MKAKGREKRRRNGERKGEGKWVERRDEDELWERERKKKRRSK